MGEIADSIINGEFCESCGEYLDSDDGFGFPVSCCDKDHPNFIGNFE